MDIGQSIRNVIEARGLTYEQFAELLGVSRQRAHTIAKSKDLKFSTIKKVSDALDINIEYLIQA
jgi:transcriptional regulator with XRE-family HTH domain